MISKADWDLIKVFINCMVTERDGKSEMSPSREKGYDCLKTFLSGLRGHLLGTSIRSTAVLLRMLLGWWNGRMAIRRLLILSVNT